MNWQRAPWDNLMTWLSQCEKSVDPFSGSADHWELVASASPSTWFNRQTLSYHFHAHWLMLFYVYGHRQGFGLVLYFWSSILCGSFFQEPVVDKKWIWGRLTCFIVVLRTFDLAQNWLWGLPTWFCEQLIICITLSQELLHRSFYAIIRLSDPPDLL